MSRKILITGASGFVGRYILNYYKKTKCEAIGTTSGADSENLIVCDIADYRQVSDVIFRTMPDTIIHCAALSSVMLGEPSDYYITNVIGTENILRSLKSSVNKKVRFIFISTAGVYGNQPVDCLHENLCPMPVHHYGMSKFCAERVVMNFEDVVDYTIVRPFNIIGKGQHSEFIVPKLANAFMSRQEYVELGNIDVYRDYMDVESACEAITKLEMAKISFGETVNLCTGRATSLRQLIEEFEKISGHSMEIRTNNKFVRNNEVWKLIGSADKLNKLLGGQIRSTDVGAVLRDMLN
jgi:nucleoside-diphosphate-sugar epimerase